MRLIEAIISILREFLLLKFGCLQRDILLLRVFLVECASWDGIVAIDGS